jgi:glutaryl-CoA dehydrogenase (non-decarboxylating)
VYYELPEEVIAMKEMAKKFSERRLIPITEGDYEKGITRREIIEEMGKLGFFGCLIPEEYGGTNTGYLSAVVIAEEIAKVNASYAGYFMCQLAGPPLTILKYGTEEQKRRYIPGIISGKLIALFAATEPDAGSDITAMRGFAIKDGDHYILNGVKTWITNATTADVGLIWVYTDKEKKREGISCFIVDMRDSKGITTRKIDKIGLRCSEAGEVILEDVKVPKENLLGGLGDGYAILMYTLSNTRLFAAARALGVSGACLEKSLEYARERVQFGQPIGEFQMIQNQLAELYVKHEAAKLLVYQAAANKDRGINDIVEVAIAKYFACEVGVEAAITAMKIFSSYGFSLEYPIHRYVRDAMAFPITEGTSNIQKLIIARSILKGKTKELGRSWYGI